MNANVCKGQGYKAVLQGGKSILPSPKILEFFVEFSHFKYLLHHRQYYVSIKNAKPIWPM
jgi:hypothetical protein